MVINWVEKVSQYQKIAYHEVVNDPIYLSSLIIKIVEDAGQKYLENSPWPNSGLNSSPYGKTPCYEDGISSSTIREAVLVALFFYYLDYFQNSFRN